MFIETPLVYRQFQGFLFIGDPHVSSKPVGRRKDDFLSSVLGKLSYCAQLCRDRNLYPVVLGDLFHRNDDNKLAMLARLTAVLQSFPVPPLVLEGNHDKEQDSLSDADALTLLAMTNVVNVAGKPGLAAVLEVAAENGGTQELRLHACPYGFDLPRSLPSGGAVNVLITHHDMAFGSAYPGAKPLQAIEGCDMVVNGHMHDTKASVLKDSTWWHNPGNIEPLSVDLATHVPQAWEWRAGQGAEALTGLLLPHAQDVFDMTGLAVEAANPLDAVRALDNVPADAGTAASAFAQMLSSQGTMDAQRTSDASVLLQDLDEVLGVATVSEATKELMQALAAELAMEL